MQINQALKSDSDLQRQAARQTHALLHLASRHFAARLEAPRVRFDLRGQSAGQLRILPEGDCLIRYNPQILERHPELFLSQTVPHETAHLVAFRLFGNRIQPHGKEWGGIMALFGAAPERCHSYPVADLQTRRLRRYEYRCGCRIHRLTSIRHNRIGSGQVYLCKQCGEPLKQVSRKT